MAEQDPTFRRVLRRQYSNFQDGAQLNWRRLGWPLAGVGAAGVVLALMLKPGAGADEFGPYYRDCKTAQLAGVAPLLRGQAGYRSHLDEDGDGIACEPYRGW
jgi:hypothetical protein